MTVMARYLVWNDSLTDDDRAVRIDADAPPAAAHAFAERDPEQLDAYLQPVELTVAELAPGSTHRFARVHYVVVHFAA